MAIYKPTELIHFLDGLGINPKKALSQNFLIDGNIIRKIVAKAQIQPGDVVIEIGPGPGSLTEALLDSGARVIAVEKDTVLARSLERFKGPDRQLEVFCADILDFPIEHHLKPGQKAKVIANLPYNIATSIITQLVMKHGVIEKLLVMVQEEVARRITAHPSSKEYGSLTVFLDFHSQPRYAFKVSKNCFFPIPNVQSAVVELVLKDPPEVSDEEAFFNMTRTSFEHRRKMLRSSLRDLYLPEHIEKALETIGKSNLSRPEELSLDEFLQLFSLLNPKLG